MKNDAERLARVRRLVDTEPATQDAPDGMVGRLHRLCGALARALPASGVAVSLLTVDRAGGGTAASSDAASRRLEELQFALGEGPCLDAFSSRRPVLAPDLAESGVSRWPAFARAAHQQGVGAAFAFPLQVGAARLGALAVYRDEPGSLTAEALSQAVTFSEVALHLLLDSQAETVAGHAPDGLVEVLSYRLEVYQAQGMLSVDLDVTLAEAIARMRGHAYATGRQLGEVAGDIVAGKLRLERDFQ